ALAMLAHSKSGAVAGTMDATAEASPDGREKKIATQHFADDWFNKTGETGTAAIKKTKKAWGNLVFAATSEVRTGTPMSYDEVRLFLQSYNAGPYACLKYKGTVPYRETQNYIPKIMKYYQQDLSNTPYDSIIVEKATKYGLDPQL